MDNQYSTIKLSKEGDTQNLEIGEYTLDRDSDTMYVGSGDFPTEE